MGGTHAQQNTGVQGNGVGGVAATEKMFMAATAAGQQQFVGVGSMVWYSLTTAMKIFEPVARTLELSKEFLKWKVDVGGESTKYTT